MKNNKTIKIISLLLFTTLLFTMISCKGKSYDMYKAQRLRKKYDLTAMLEARNLYRKYSGEDTVARESLASVNKDIGEMLTLNSDFGEALEYLNESLSINPNQFIVHYYLGVCYSNLYSSEIIDQLAEEYEKKVKRISNFC